MREPREHLHTTISSKLRTILNHWIVEKLSSRKGGSYSIFLILAFISLVLTQSLDRIAAAKRTVEGVVFVPYELYFSTRKYNERYRFGAQL